MYSRRLVALLALLLLCACGLAPVPTAQAPTAPSSTPAATLAPSAAPVSPSPTAAPAGVTITDIAGRTVTVGPSPQRIISLAPSTTEIAFALDLGTRVVAVDDFSDYPAAATALPKVGGTDAHYNLEQIVALKPDLVLAAGIAPPETIARLDALKLTVVVLGTPLTTFQTVFDDIAMVGRITGQEAQAVRVVGQMQRQRDAIRAAVARATSTPRVYWELDATDPAKPFSVGSGNFVGDLIALAGGVNVFADAQSPFPQVSVEHVVAANPDVIILADAGYGVTAEAVAARPGWGAIGAVQKGRITPISGDLTTRPGPRIVEGLAATARILHPELFP